MVVGKQFVEINLQPVSTEKSIYLKIRPHLVLSGSDIRKANKTTQLNIDGEIKGITPFKFTVIPNKIEMINNY